MWLLRQIARCFVLTAPLTISGCAQVETMIFGDKAAGEQVATAAAVPGIYKIGEPYQVDDVWYYPKLDYDYDETGIGSWYGDEFDGKVTANGEVYDMDLLTAAHPTLPLPSYVRVTNLENGRSIRLRVNDRGPFKRGRIIDVSRRAAQLLGYYDTGTAKVRVEVLNEDSRRAASLAMRGVIPDGERIRVEEPRGVVTAELLAPPPGVAAATSAPATLSDAVPTSVTSPRETPVETASLSPKRAPGNKMIGSMGLGTEEPVVQLTRVTPTSIYVQAGAFSKMDNAVRLRARLAPLGPVTVMQVSIRNQPFFRVRLGPVDSVEAADRLLATVIESGHPEARIVVD